MPGLTNNGSKRITEAFLTGGYTKWRDYTGSGYVTLSKWQAALLRDSSAIPTADTVKMDDAGIVEASFTGYARVDVPLSTVGWTSFTTDNTLDKVICALQDCSFTCSGGSAQTVSYLALVSVASGGDAAGATTAQIIWVFGMSPQLFSSGTTIVFQNGKFECRNTSW